MTEKSSSHLYTCVRTRACACARTDLQPLKALSTDNVEKTHNTKLQYLQSLCVYRAGAVVCPQLNGGFVKGALLPPPLLEGLALTSNRPLRFSQL